MTKVMVHIEFDPETQQFSVSKGEPEAEMAEGGMEGMEGMQSMMPVQEQTGMQPGAQSEGAAQTFQSVDEALQAAKQLLTQTDESMATDQDQQAGFDSVQPKGIM